MDKTYDNPLPRLLFLAGVLSLILLGVYALNQPLQSIPYLRVDTEPQTLPRVEVKVDVSTSHGHGDPAIQEKCTGSPYWLNPVTRYTIRWCDLGQGKIGYQVLRWVQKIGFWKEVTHFDDRIKQGYTLEQTVEEYLVNTGYINIEWARDLVTKTLP